MVVVADCLVVFGGVKGAVGGWAVGEVGRWVVCDAGRWVVGWAGRGTVGETCPTVLQMQLVVLPAQDLTLFIDHACVAVRKPVIFAPTGAHRPAATLNVAQPYKNSRVSS